MRRETLQVRHSIIAGTWYPGQAEKLRQTVQNYLNAVETPAVKGPVIGLVAPHAGYVYSGQVAAHAYRQLQGNGKPVTSFDLVVVLAPLHRMYLGEFVTTEAAHYETPLGLVPLDAQAVDALDQAVGLHRARSDNEHSLEIQLPFLQVVLGEFKLLPVMMGHQGLAACQRLAAALIELVRGKSALLVASTDLSHFYPYSRAVQIDRATLQYFEAFDPEGLARALEAHRAEACGGGPVVTALLAARALGADKTQVLKYANSGDVTGDRSVVVGYAAGIISRERA